MGGRGEIFWELCSHAAAAIQTKFTRSLVLGDLQLDGWELENLAFFLGIDGLVVQINAAILAIIKGDGHRKYSYLLRHHAINGQTKCGARILSKC